MWNRKRSPKLSHFILHRKPLDDMLMKVRRVLNQKTKLITSYVFAIQYTTEYEDHNKSLNFQDEIPQTPKMTNMT